MATTNFTTSLKLALPTTGDLVGTWGDAINNSITTLLDTAVAGNITKDMAALGTNWTLTSNNGATDEARYAILIPYGNTGTTRSIFAPKVSKAYIIVNKTNASVIIRGGPTSPTTGVTVVAGATVVVAWDSNLATPDFVAVTPASISGVVPVANGGTGTASPTLVPGTNVTISGTWPNQTINASGGGGGGSVISVSGTAPVVSSGGTTPVISMAAATTSVNGYLTNTDWNTFNGKYSTGGALGTPSSGTLTNCTADGTNKVGYRNIPQTGSDKTTAYELVLTDVGKYVGVGSSGSVVVPTSTFANGDAISVYNNTTGNITITTSALTAYIGGTNTAKTSITLATRGIATILFVSSTVCVVTGNVS